MDSNKADSGRETVELQYLHTLIIEQAHAMRCVRTVFEMSVSIRKICNVFPILTNYGEESQSALTFISEFQHTQQGASRGKSTDETLARSACNKAAFTNGENLVGYCMEQTAAGPYVDTR